MISVFVVARLKDYIRLFAFSTMCMSAFFMQSHLFTDSYIVPKWLVVLLIALGMGLYCSISILFTKSMKVNIPLMGMGLIQVCFLQAIYGLLQYFAVFFSHSIYKITGSFDNPAGFAACLCAGLPFVGFLISQNDKKHIRYSGWIISVIITTAVVLSYSRAGIISIAVVCAILLFQKLNQKRIWQYLLLSSLALILFGGYWMKKDSADGRLLIWQCGINMVKDAPFLGHGIGSFEAHYMDYQADYFKLHEKSRFSILADNVKQPFNEYLGVLLNFGIVGLLVLST